MANMRRAFREHTYRVAVHTQSINGAYMEQQTHTGGVESIEDMRRSRHTTGDLRHIWLVFAYLLTLVFSLCLAFKIFYFLPQLVSRSFSTPSVFNSSLYLL